MLRSMPERSAFQAMQKIQAVVIDAKLNADISQPQPSTTSSDNTRESNLIFAAMSDADIFDDEDENTILF